MHDSSSSIDNVYETVEILVINVLDIYFQKTNNQSFDSITDILIPFPPDIEAMCCVRTLHVYNTFNLISYQKTR